MKELTIEQKAKAYDEAIEKARKLATDLPNGRNDRLYHIWDLENIFPELKESKDERIRKELIEYVKDQQSSFISAPDCRDKYEEEENNKYNSWIAWLEKQGLQNLANSAKICKDEPKFKAGDWVINGKREVAHIAEVRKDSYGSLRYYIEWENGNKSDPMPCFVDDDFHLWKIEDAKDGDVLASELSDSIILFKGIEDNNIQFYCDYDFSEIDVPGDRFSVNNSGQHYGNIEESEDFHPATKEQRDLLFQKMKEAGYEWLKETHELKKISQRIISAEAKEALYDKPAWIEEDKKLTDVNHEYFSELLENNNSKNINDYVYQVVYCMSHDWANETPTWDDVQKACKLGAEWNEKRHKSTWSEEDEVKINRIVACLENLNVADNDILLKDVDWLKQLKQRIGWKPSDEQMDTLWDKISNDNLPNSEKEISQQVALTELYEQLKKL